VDLFRNLRGEREYFVQFVTQGPSEINGDEATARCVCHEAARGPGESYYRNNGVWFDHLRRSTNDWVFTKRTTSTCGSTSPHSPETSSRSNPDSTK
jgi:hypothetical protein